MSGSADKVESLRVSVVRPQQVPDVGYAEKRGDGYGDEFVVPWGRYRMADEGPYFICKNATPGTGVAGHAAPTTFDQAKPYIVMYNGAAPGGDNAYIDYLKLRVTAAGTGGTRVHFNVVTELGNRYSANGADYSAKAGQAAGYTTPNPLLNPATVFSIIRIGGTCAATAAGATARTLVNEVLRPVISVADDLYIVKFGAVGEPSMALNSIANGGTAIAQVNLHAPPVIVPPGYSVLFHIWQPSQSAASSYEFELAWWER